MRDSARPLSRLLACPLLALSDPLASFALPALLVVRRGVGRGVVFRAVVRCGGTFRSSLVPPCRSAGRRVACLRFSSRYSVRSARRRSSSCGSVRLANCLPCVARLGNRRGWRGGSLVALCLLGWGGRGSVWIMWSVLFLVDYLGTVGYIISRALMLFSPFFVSWHVLVVRAALLVLPPQSLSSICLHELVPPGHGRERFFLSIFISSHPIIGCLLAGLLFTTRLPSYPYRPAPRPATIDTIGGEVHGYDTTDGWRAILLASGGDRWRRELMGCDVMLA